ncbi:helix-hairpin-helix domain-containing protein [uncultured Apibacter sp.]|uniref:helix-hairpin-helix domain-containing protein n=1 Tax=uncultured Apibacter sp. TaxID=1778616 RepID=UPI0025E8F888|nr:helix-hairpin-helix domain-containing protein [uncultured Apibacter sp.]
MNLRLKMIKEQRMGVLLLLSIIFILEIIIHSNFLFSSSLDSNVPFSFVEEINDEIDDNKLKDKKLELFDPNKCTSEDWQHLGFSKKQAEVLIKYKAKLGGTFSSKEQIKSCFVISEEMFSKISPFLLLPDGNVTKEELNESKNIRYKLRTFDPNIFEIKDWVNIGFSEKQAESILKYKKTLGDGIFSSKEDIKRCYVISSSKYKELEDFIILPKHIYENKTVLKVNTQKDLNSATYQDIFSIINNEIITKRILGFRKVLGGFVSLEQVKDVYDITPDMVRKIFDSFILDLTKVKKINLQTASEQELHNQVYIRKYKSKILEARNKGKDPLQVIPESDPKYQFIMNYLEQ